MIEQPEPTTNSTYDVVGKSITEEIAAMDSGETTAAQITKAYLDRIAAYNGGPLGFHALISVNPKALEEAREDDILRAEGDNAPLLGIRSRSRTSTTRPNCRPRAAASCSKTTSPKRTPSWSKN